MPYRKIQLANNEIYHIVIKRIGDELLFRNIGDYYRGIFSIYEFNNAKSVRILDRRKAIKRRKEIFKLSQGRVLRQLSQNPTLRQANSSRDNWRKLDSGIVIPDERDKLVEVLAFAFMPTHIHLLLRQLKDDGISL